MTEMDQEKSAVAKHQKKKKFDNPLYSLGVVGSALAVPVVAYFAFDLVTAELSPCETIFRESSVGLTTKISFLQSEGEVQIGRQKLRDLSDRATAVALNLKTCCTVLDAGKIDQEQFLQCKSNSRGYDARIDELVKLVRTAVAEKPKADMIVTGSTGVMAAAAAMSPEIKNVQSRIAAKVKEAEQVSKQFNKQVVQVRKAQALEQLKIVPPQNVEIGAQEREPNNDLLNTNQIELGKWVTGAVSEVKDSDVYVFTVPEKHRDWIKIEVQNRSTTLRPIVSVYNSQKARIGGKANETHGGDVTHSFVVAPNAKFFVRVGDRYDSGTGAYLVRVSSSKAYDAHEPNQTILTAKSISLGSTVEAGIMDGGDIDYYVIKTKGKKSKLTVQVENRSASLRPRIIVYNGAKAQIGSVANETYGGDRQYEFDVAADSKYYIRIDGRYNSSAGDYLLTVDQK